MNIATRDTGKGSSKKETRRSQSVEYAMLLNTPELAMYQGLKDYVDCRLKMIDLYLNTFQNYGNFHLLFTEKLYRKAGAMERFF